MTQPQVMPIGSIRERRCGVASTCMSSFAGRFIQPYEPSARQLRRRSASTPKNLVYLASCPSKDTNQHKPLAIAGWGRAGRCRMGALTGDDDGAAEPPCGTSLPAVSGGGGVRQQPMLAMPSPSCQQECRIRGRRHPAASRQLVTPRLLRRINGAT